VLPQGEVVREASAMLLSAARANAAGGEYIGMTWCTQELAYRAQVKHKRAWQTCGFFESLFHAAKRNDRLAGQACLGERQLSTSQLHASVRVSSSQSTALMVS
jgi:hypothetical protein